MNHPPAPVTHSFVAAVRASVRVEQQRDAALAEVVRLEAVLERVRALHVEGGVPERGWCSECGLSWPCATFCAVEDES